MSEWQRGYPDDRRTAKQRAKAAADHIGWDFEYMAGRVMARLTGEYVVIQDDGSAHSMPDIRIEYADGRIGFGECWMDVDRRHAEVSGGLAGGRSSMAVPSSSRVWTVRVNGEFRLKKREVWLPQLLAELEAQGKVFEIVAEAENLERDPSPTVQRARQRGIRGLASRPVVGDEQGRVDFSVWGIGGPAEVSWEPFMEWIRESLFANDENTVGIRKKLAEAGSDERHAFVGVTFDSPWEVNRVLCRSWWLRWTASDLAQQQDRRVGHPLADCI